MGLNYASERLIFLFVAGILIIFSYVLALPLKVQDYKKVSLFLNSFHNDYGMHLNVLIEP